MQTTTSKRRHTIGLGLDVPYTDPKGNLKTGHASLSTNCSDDSGGGAFALQQMLNDLGYGPLVVDGQVGTNTFKALDAFAASTGTAYTKGSLPKGAICDALMAAWQHSAAPVGPSSSPGAVPVMTGPASGPAAPATGPGPSHLDLARLSKLIDIQNYKPRSDGIVGWFQGQTTPIKIGVVVGGLALVGGVVYLVMQPKPYAANRRRRHRRHRR
jgi:hypothetical protein